jgi:hypothetical protein
MHPSDYLLEKEAAPQAAQAAQATQATQAAQAAQVDHDLAWREGREASKAVVQKEVDEASQNPKGYVKQSILALATSASRHQVNMVWPELPPCSPHIAKAIEAARARFVAGRI